MQQATTAGAVCLADAAATRALGAALAGAWQQCAQPAWTVFLHGDLGAGKTTLTRGVLQGLGWAEAVKSPSFSLLEQYAIGGTIVYHFDFYRFSQPEEYLDAGFDELFSISRPGVLRLVEWPEKAAPFLPAADVALTLAWSAPYAPETGRMAQFEFSTSARGMQCLSRLSTCGVGSG